MSDQHRKRFMVELDVVTRVDDRSEIVADVEWTICGDQLYRHGRRIGRITAQVWATGKPVQVYYLPVPRAVAAA